MRTVVNGRAWVCAWRWFPGQRPSTYRVCVASEHEANGHAEFVANFTAVIDDFGSLVQVES